MNINVKIHHVVTVQSIIWNLKYGINKIIRINVDEGTLRIKIK